MDSDERLARECPHCVRESAEYWGQLIPERETSDYIDTPNTTSVFRCTHCSRFLFVSAQEQPGVQPIFEKLTWYIQETDPEIVPP